MDAINLLVFDDTFAEYQRSLVAPDWNVHIFKSEPLDDIEQKYTAILLDFAWLERINSATEEAALLEKIKVANIPWIIFTSGTWTHYERAMLMGASGFISKEEWADKRLPQEILSIIQPNPPQVLSTTVPASLRHIQEVIAYLLCQPTVCTPNWTDFFGKAPEEVFDEEVLHTLYDCTLRNLQHIIRYAVFNAHLSKVKKIANISLTQRFQGVYNSDDVDEWKSQVAARAYLDKINAWLEDLKSISAVAKKEHITEAELKGRLRDIRIKHPNIDIRRNYKAIYTAFPVQFAVFYANEQGDAAQLFKSKYLRLLMHDFHSAIFDYKLHDSGTEIDGRKIHTFMNAPEIHAFAETVDAFIFFLSGYFIDPDFIGAEVAPKALERQTDGRPAVIGILMEPCNWQYVMRNGDFKILPNHDEPLLDGIDLNTAFTRIMDNIRAEIFSIWPV